MKKPNCRLDLILLVVLVTMIIQLCTGCATTADPNRGARVRQALLQDATEVLGSFATTTLQSYVSGQLQGGKADLGSAAALGGWAAATSIVDSAKLQRLMDAYSGGKIPNVTDAAATTMQQAVDKGVSPAKAATAVADVISAVSINK